MGKYTITTLGCKVNQSESDAISRLLRQSGWVPASKSDRADICIINTCTVTSKASMQSRQATRKAIRTHPEARILVTGCYAQTEPDEIKKIAGVNDIIGLSDKSRIPDILNEFLQSSPPGIGPGAYQRDLPIVSPEDIPMSTRARPFVKIQDGCNGTCTYCIVPSARGLSRSIPPEIVLERIQQIAQEGYHEAVLTGIHMGGYGLDLTPPTSLSALLFSIHVKKADCRIRLSSIEPGELNDDIIHLVADSGQFCHHFHVPLQSGDDTILKKMNRPYNRMLFRDLILRIRQRIPDAAIGTDILVGFPGEADSAFENTYALIEELPISYIHVFPFSRRKGTPAADYPDQVSWDIIKKRSKKMRNLGHMKKKAFFQGFIHKRVEMIVEGEAPESPGFLKGTTSNYIPVRIQGENHLKHLRVTVSIDHVDDATRVTGSLLA